MMKRLEKLRLNDGVVGGRYGQRQEQRFQAYQYEEYKTYGEFRQEIEEQFRFGGGQLLHLNLGFGHKGKKQEEEELYGNPRIPLTKSQPLKYKARVSDDEEEEDEDDYRVRLRQYRKEHQEDMVRQQPRLPYRPQVVHHDHDGDDDDDDDGDDDDDDDRYRNTQSHNNGRTPNFKLTPPPMTPPTKNNKLSDGRRGRHEESRKVVAPEVLTRLVFVKPSPGRSGGGPAVMSPEKRWNEPAAAIAMGNRRVQHGGYVESKWVRHGL